MNISVVMATYNGARYIVEQLDSIRTQSRPVDEVVIRDDRSSDGTVAIVEKYIERYGLAGWSIAVNERNLGYADNFHTAMAHATGDLVVFCDQDDVWLPDRIERMEACFAHDPRIKALYSEFGLFYESDDVARVSSPVVRAMTFDDTVEQAPFTSPNLFIRTEGCTMAVRADFLREIEPYWFDGFAHDEFVWKMALAADGLFCLHRATLRRRIHGGNVSTSKLHDVGRRLAFLENLEQGHRAMLDYARDLGSPAERVRMIERDVDGTARRVAMMRDRELWQVAPLALRYRDCFYSWKAIPVEFLMSLKGR